MSKEGVSESSKGRSNPIQSDTNRFFFKCLLLAFSIQLFWTPSVEGAVIAVDARHSDLTTGADYSQFRATILEAGHTIVTISSFTTVALEGADALIARQPRGTFNTYTADEIAAIGAFVAEGHGLLFLGEAGRDTSITIVQGNQILAPYGLELGITANESGATITGFVPHPVTWGVTSIGVDFSRGFSTIEPPAIDLTVSSNPYYNVLAAVAGENGAGNVVAFGDTQTWRDPGQLSDTSIAFGDNRRLLQNAVEFITVPEPSIAILLAVGITAACCGRSRRSTVQGSDHA